MAFETWWEEGALAALATFFLASLWFLMEGWFHPGCYGPAFLDAVDTTETPTLPCSSILGDSPTDLE